MFTSHPKTFRTSLLCAAVTLALCAPARAQDSSSVTEKLIELLVAKGVLPRDQAAGLLAEARKEARAPAKPAHAARNAAPAGAVAGAAAGGAAAAATEAEPAVPPGTVRVTYVPDIVRQQIADQVRQQVMQQAKSEGWAQPNVLPEWVQRVTIYGDLRIRGELDDFQKSNNPFFPDFNTINAGSGFDTSGGALPPLLNTTENRDRVRVRARLGAIARIDDWVSTEIRIATGNDSSPVSTNQTFGTPGNFSKTAIWLDRAYFKLTPTPWLTLNLGRGPNPFWTTDLLYYNDLNFDGFSAQATYAVTDSVGTFLTAGAFPVFNSAFNFSSSTGPQYPSRNKWLFAVQGGAEWRISDDYAAKIGVGYFNYSNIQGKLSSPCTLIYSSDNCNSDSSRANFLQFGNTLFPIRNIVPNPNNPTASSTPQFFGLASPFGILDLHGRVDFNNFRPIGIALEGDYVNNLAFNRAAIVGRGPVNNLGATPTSFQGGNAGYLVRLTVGTPEIAKRWDWNVSVAYKYLESDAVLDALTDPDFHLGGTNAKGYIIGGNLGIARNTYLTAKWLSANQVSGPTYAVDVLQLELNSRF